MLKLFLLIDTNFKICGTIETTKLKISTESWKLYNLNMKCRNKKKIGDFGRKLERAKEKISVLEDRSQ